MSLSRIHCVLYLPSESAYLFHYAFHHAQSCHVTSCRIVSNGVRSCRIVSDLVESCRIVSCCPRKRSVNASTAACMLSRPLAYLTPPPPFLSTLHPTPRVHAHCLVLCFFSPTLRHVTSRHSTSLHVMSTPHHSTPHHITPHLPTKTSLQLHSLLTFPHKTNRLSPLVLRLATIRRSTLPPCQPSRGRETAGARAWTTAVVVVAVVVA